MIQYGIRGEKKGIRKQASFEKHIFFFVLFLATLWRVELRSQGLDPSLLPAVVTLDPLTHCARLGIEPLSWCCRDAASPIAPE